MVAARRRRAGASACALAAARRLPLRPLGDLAVAAAGLIGVGRSLGRRRHAGAGRRGWRLFAAAPLLAVASRAPGCSPRPADPLRAGRPALGAHRPRLYGDRRSSPLARAGAGWPRLRAGRRLPSRPRLFFIACLVVVQLLDRPAPGRRVVGLVRSSGRPGRRRRRHLGRDGRRARPCCGVVEARRRPHGRGPAGGTVPCSTGGRGLGTSAVLGGRAGRVADVARVPRSRPASCCSRLAVLLDAGTGRGARHAAPAVHRASASCCRTSRCSWPSSSPAAAALTRHRPSAVTVGRLVRLRRSCRGAPLAAPPSRSSG